MPTRASASSDTLQTILGSLPSGDTLIIDRVVVASTSTGTLSVDVPAATALVFEDDGKIIGATTSPTQVITVTLSGPVVAPVADRVLFDLSLSGSGSRVVPVHRDTLWYANWWWGTSMDARWSRMVGNKATGDLLRSGAAAPRRFAVVGEHDLLGPLDLTGFRERQSFYFQGSKLTSKFNGEGASAPHASVDMTDSDGLAVHDLTLVGSVNGSSQAAKVGVLVARDDDGSTPLRDAGHHVFYDLRVSGDFRIAALYNIASEGNVFLAGLFENDDETAKYAAFFSWIDDDSLGSTFARSGATPLNPGNNHSTPASRATAETQSLYGTKIVQTGASGTSGPLGTLYINGFHHLTADNLVVRTGKNTAAHVVVDSTDRDVYGPALSELHTFAFGSGQTPKYGVKVVDDASTSNKVIGLRLVARQLLTEGSGARAIYVDGNAKLELCSFHFAAAAGLEATGAATLHNCDINTLGKSDVPVLLPDGAGGEFFGTIFMGGDLTSTSTFRPAATTEGLVVAAGGQSSPQVRCYGSFAVKGYDLKLDNNKGLEWGNAKIRGDGGTGTAHISLIDRAGATVAFVTDNKLRVPANRALSFKPTSAGTPTLESDEAIIRLEEDGSGVLYLKAWVKNGTNVQQATIVTAT